MRKRAIISVNAAVLLFGLAGLFAKWIDLPALGITFGRVLFSAAALGIYIKAGRQSLRIADRKDRLSLLGGGTILALHWWAFLGSIQRSTVAVGTITFASFPLFVTFLEPLLRRRKPEKQDVAIAAIILIGVLITASGSSFEGRMLPGFLIGMVSSAAYAVLTVMNKRISERYSGTVTAFYEQTTAAVVLLPFAIGAKLRPSADDLALLLFLGVVTTALAHSLFIASLKTLPAQLAGVCASLETVYGILFAFLLLGEAPSVREIIGAVVVVGAVVIAQTRRER